MDDLISRQAAIDAVKAYLTDCQIEDADWHGNGIECELENLSPAQPERKTGKWIYNSPVTMKCDQCGLVIKDWDWNRFKFCPNCGAKMKGEI